MEKTSKAVAWICIFSTVLMGCYSSELIEPTEAEKERVYTDRIDYVVTKDGKKHEFVEPPVVAKDTIVGWYAQSTWYTPWDLEQVSIPLSDVAEVSAYRFNTLKTLTFVGAMGATIAVTYAVTYAIIADNFRHHFFR